MGVWFAADKLSHLTRQTGESEMEVQLLGLLVKQLDKRLHLNFVVKT